MLNKAVDIVTNLGYDTFKSGVEFPIPHESRHNNDNIFIRNLQNKNRGGYYNQQLNSHSNFKTFEEKMYGEMFSHNKNNGNKV